MKNKVRWGILGCAGIAEEQFLPALAACKDSVLHAIGSRERSKAEAWAEKWGAAKAYGSYEEVLADPVVEAVYIPLPNHLHKEWIIKAFRAKKHVLCEKPMGVSVLECEDILEAANKEERFFMEAFMYRFHPQIQQTLTWIKEGQIGDVRLVRGSFSFFLEDAKNVRLQDYAGAGSLWDVGCYPIHLMNLIFAGPPLEVLARAGFTGKIDHSMTALLHYGVSQEGIFDCSFSMAPQSFIEIVGTKGSIRIPRPWRPDGQEVSIILAAGNRSAEITFPVNNPYQLEIEHFQDCLRGKVDSLLPGYLGRDVAATIEACHQSALQGLVIQVAKANRTAKEINMGKG